MSTKKKKIIVENARTWSVILVAYGVAYMFESIGTFSIDER